MAFFPFLVNAVEYTWAGNPGHFPGMQKLGSPWLPKYLKHYYQGMISASSPDNNVLLLRSVPLCIPYPEIQTTAEIALLLCKSSFPNKISTKVWTWVSRGSKLLPGITMLISCPWDGSWQGWHGLCMVNRLLMSKVKESWYILVMKFWKRSVKMQRYYLELLFTHFMYCF